jgi:23S rRNA (cytosine1962-C5)-methyltransferase
MKTETRLLVAADWTDYALLDSGHGQKLERFGSETVIRPDPQAFWMPAQPIDTWRAGARFRDKGGEDESGGQWEILSPRAADVWPMQWRELRFHARRTAFRHMGVFQEHSVHWQFAIDQIKAARRPISVLNLFGYTGLMSLACASAGASVTHLDASPKSNAFGKENQDLSGLSSAPIRWIADDAMKFVAREIRRESRYDLIVLDPPKFGRGPKSETWRFEEELPALLDGVRVLLSDRPLGIILTAYAVRLSHLALSQTLADRLEGLGGVMETGEMALPQHDSARLLPTAIFARWRAQP